MNKGNKNEIVTHGRAEIAAAMALAILSACAGSFPVPVQTQPQKPETSFVDALRGLLTDRAQPNLGAPAQPQVEPARAPEASAPIVWPALGPGDFPPYWYLPTVVWPAPGAGDFLPDWYVPNVVWPPRGTEDVVAPLPGWRAGPVLAPTLSVTQKVAQDMLDRHPRPVVLERAYWLLRPVYESKTPAGMSVR